MTFILLPCDTVRASEWQECRNLTAELISSAVERESTPSVKCNEPVGRMMLGGTVFGRRALKEVTLLRNAGVRRGRHIKCVLGGAFGFIVNKGQSWSVDGGG